LGVEEYGAGQLDDAQYVGEGIHRGGWAIPASRARKLDAWSFKVAAAGGILAPCSKWHRTRNTDHREVSIMTRSGEWIGTQALNAMRHRMGSRDAVDTVAAR